MNCVGFFNELNSLFEIHNTATLGVDEETMLNLAEKLILNLQEKEILLRKKYC